MKTFPLVTGLLAVLFLEIRSGDSTLCDVALPQDVPLLSKCYILRKAALKRRRDKFNMTPGNAQLPYPLLSMAPKELLKTIQLDPFLRCYGNAWLLMGATGELTKMTYLEAFPSEISNITQYENIAEFFRVAFHTALGGDNRLPSAYSAFSEDLYHWLDDKYFAQQRLAGVNPMSLKRISMGTGVGLDWDELQKNLNSDFDWEAAVESVLCGKETFQTAVQNGYVFGLRYKECDNLPKGPDLTEHDPNRSMWRFNSPIALFVVSPTQHDAGLQPIAIQMDYTPDSKVYTPADGDNWFLAKLNVQVTDLGYAQIVEHLAYTHFLMEPLCVCAKRTLSYLHPLYQMLKFHCREVTIPDKFGFPVLQKVVPQLFAYGLDGMFMLLQRGRSSFNWERSDFRGNIQRRGLDDKNILKYFPYRDDGEEILSLIEDMVNGYVDLYYKDDKAVKKDRELNNLLNEASIDGTGSTGGIGQIPGLPPEITTKAELCDLLTRMIWQLSGQHTAVNYLISDYAAFVPNNPTKLYNDTRVAPGEFNVYRLPNKLTAVTEVALSMGLASFRFDNLFDYGSELQDNAATDLVDEYYSQLIGNVARILEDRNSQRYNNGDLTYPYLLPQWLPNGIQT